LALCLFVWTSIPAAKAQTPVQKNVLIINEVGLAHPASSLVTEQLMSRLAADHRFQTEFYVESLDSPIFSSDNPQGEIEARLLQKYEDRKIDVIVAMGPAPIALLSRVSDTFLPEVPVVFCGSTQIQAGNPKLGPRFTGSWMSLDAAKTLEASMRLLPELHNVVVVSGSSQFDKATLTLTKQSLAAHPLPLNFIYLSDLDMSSLLERLRYLPKGSVVLYLSFFRDAAGSQFVNATTALPLVSETANAPVFGISDTYLGHGIVGGHVVSFSQQAKTAAVVTAEILEGKKPADIPVVTGASFYGFDWKQLKRWNLSESMLPAGSVVINREPTLWERAKWIFLAAASMLLGLLALAAYLLHERKQLKAAREEQTRLSGKLIGAQEEERSRLAAELHDDFSQRMAVLSLGLETAAEMISESPGQATRQLQELMNSAGEIGSDLHTLSHRLHSATLERLGLTAGVSAFCREFIAQHGIAVTFSHVDLPRSVSPDLALCLFRIVQEGLRNVKKHSEATHADVRLEKIEEQLHLCISDNGKGFDPKGVSERQGLGLWSMQERVRLVNGRCEIRSAPRNGTWIDVWVSLSEPSAAAASSQVANPPYAWPRRKAGEPSDVISRLKRESGSRY